ncbi:peptide-methionine (S)-S-oxide reductase MsrA [Piscinibacterium candidicorallinum]|uniref:Peptide methionine sulfoxide reductase MsrA n=1 Tax=Piscinibacterium candidicorallinum TaxID=1793872 RepID=A0ABV7H1T6_9BURK
MTPANIETATLGGGCFWCLEAVYQRVRGVQHVQSGYAAGHSKNPSYEAVCSETTGHAEVVRLQYDPSVISYRQVLEIFFSIHDPTTLNRQGNDVGESYRSIIIPHSDAQIATAREVMAEAQRAHRDPIVTQLTGTDQAVNYWPAEDYHQDYFNQHPNQGYCAFVVAPKVQKFMKTFKDFLA